MPQHELQYESMVFFFKRKKRGNISKKIKQLFNAAQLIGVECAF